MASRLPRATSTSLCCRQRKRTSDFCELHNQYDKTVVCSSGNKIWLRVIIDDVDWNRQVIWLGEHRMVAPFQALLIMESDDRHTTVDYCDDSGNTACFFINLSQLQAKTGRPLEIIELRLHDRDFCREVLFLQEVGGLGGPESTTSVGSLQQFHLPPESDLHDEFLGTSDTQSYLGQVSVLDKAFVDSLVYTYHSTRWIAARFVNIRQQEHVVMRIHSPIATIQCNIMKIVLMNLSSLVL